MKVSAKRIWNGHKRRYFVSIEGEAEDARFGDGDIDHPIYVWSGKRKFRYLCPEKRKCLCRFIGIEINPSASAER